MKLKMPPWKKVLVFTGLFLTFSVLLFPYQNLKGKIFNQIQQQTGIYIEARSLSFWCWGWPGFLLREVEVALPVADTTVTIAAKKVILSVGIASLWPPTPSFNVSVYQLSKGGDVTITYSENSKRIKTSLMTKELDLEVVKIPPNMTFKGKLSVEGSFYIAKSDLTKSSGQFFIAAKKLALPEIFFSGGKIPSLFFGELSGGGQIKNGFFEFQNLKFGDAKTSVEGNVAGDVKLSESFYQSKLNLKTTFKFSDAVKNDPEAATLLSTVSLFDPEKKGEYTLGWSQSIQKTIQSYGLPDALAELFNLKQL